VGELSPWHWAIVILIAVLLFGSRRLPDAARSLGRSARILKAELREGAATPHPTEPSTTTRPTEPAPPAAALRESSTGEPQPAVVQEVPSDAPREAAVRDRAPAPRAPQPDEGT
jgi:sec-independent protein translocase protein TatA